MEREIYLEDENGGKYLLKYLDEANRRPNQTLNAG